MYPKVKVREQIEGGDHHCYDRSCVQSLKAFEWLSLDHFSASGITFLTDMVFPNIICTTTVPTPSYVSRVLASKFFLLIFEMIK